MTRTLISPLVRFSVWQRDGFRCTYCQRSAISEQIVLEVDHVIAVRDGGSNDLSNLTTACRPCNRIKGPRGLRRPAGGLGYLPAALSSEVYRCLAALQGGRSNAEMAAILGVDSIQYWRIKKGERRISYEMTKRAGATFPEVLDIVMRDLTGAA